MTLIEIYESAQIVRRPPEALGGGEEVRVNNRDAMLVVLARHRRRQEFYIALIFLVVLAIFFTSLYIAFRKADVSSALPVTLPLLGGGLFVALLAFLRWLLKTHDEGGMLDAMLHFASDEQLAVYVELRLAIKRRKLPRKRSTSPVSRSVA